MRSPMRNGSAKPTAISPGNSSTKIPPPACATRRALPAIPRACSIRTARTCCTRCCRCSRMRSAFPRVTSFMPIVPMFHANSWGLAFSAPMAGAALVHAGRQARRTVGLRDAQRLQGHLQLAPCRRCGWRCCKIWKRPAASFPISSASLSAAPPCPRAMIKIFRDEYGVEVFHAWGMTEMSPLGTVGSLKPRIRRA